MTNNKIITTNLVSTPNLINTQIPPPSSVSPIVFQGAWKVDSEKGSEAGSASSISNGNKDMSMPTEEPQIAATNGVKAPKKTAKKTPQLSQQKSKQSQNI